MKIRKNPDTEHANEILQALRENGGYCPCKIEKTDDTKCVCLEFRQQQSGMCHCGLYIKSD